MTRQSPSKTDFDPAVARSIIAEHVAEPGGLLAALNALQARFGYVDGELIAPLADAFNLSRAEVHGVISFYHDFRDRPPGRHVVRICQAEACQAMGSRGLTAHAKEVLGLDFGETNAGEGLTLEPVYCLGNCAAAPAVMIGETVHGRVDATRLDMLVAACRKGVRA
ncbi:MAG: formate dehydrogenase subunit gamma [Alphaproteobacteria bacterium]|nr:MAG: formate dehydrogenase subunit gamma [Alphaproteobacteria bacterium]